MLVSNIDEDDDDDGDDGDDGYLSRSRTPFPITRFSKIPKTLLLIKSSFLLKRKTRNKGVKKHAENKSNNISFKWKSNVEIFESVSNTVNIVFF